MDWTNIQKPTDAAQTGGDRARLGVGRHVVTVKRFITEAKAGPVTDKMGNPAALVIFANDDGEALDKVPLASASTLIWKFQNLVAACCSTKELQDLTRDHVEPEHFGGADSPYVRRYLLGREVVIDVTPGKNGFTNLKVSASPASGSVRAPGAADRSAGSAARLSGPPTGLPEPDDADIPF